MNVQEINIDYKIHRKWFIFNVYFEKQNWLSDQIIDRNVNKQFHFCQQFGRRKQKNKIKIKKIEKKRKKIKKKNKKNKKNNEIE
jgi:hypothetical protein